MFSAKKLAGLVAVLALSATPAFAVSADRPDNQGTAHAPTTTPAAPPTSQGAEHRHATPGPNASAQSKARAYGRYCQDQSKKHVAGTPGTPFSRCVTAMAKVAHDNVNPTTACKTLSRKHTAGERGTPFSRCVSAAAKLQHDQS